MKKDCSAKLIVTTTTEGEQSYVKEYNTRPTV